MKTKMPFGQAFQLALTEMFGGIWLVVIPFLVVSWLLDWWPLKIVLFMLVR